MVRSLPSPISSGSWSALCVQPSRIVLPEIFDIEGRTRLVCELVMSSHILQLDLELLHAIINYLKKSLFLSFCSSVFGLVVGIDSTHITDTYGVWIETCSCMRTYAVIGSPFVDRSVEGYQVVIPDACPLVRKVHLMDVLYCEILSFASCCAMKDDFAR